MSKAITGPDLVKHYFAFDGIDLGADGLSRPNAVDPANEIPVVLVVQHSAGYDKWLRATLPDQLRAQLRALAANQAFHDQQLVAQLLAPAIGTHTIWEGVGYIFPPTLSAADYPDVVQLTEQHRVIIERYAPGMNIEQYPVFGIIMNKQLVATCESTRENELGGEAWVQTLPQYRGRGFGRQVTTAWAHNLQARGKTPFYNHKRTNTASAALARSLKLMQFMADVSYT